MKKIAILCTAYPHSGGKAENTIFGYLSKYILEKNYYLDFYFINHENNPDIKLIKKKYSFLKKKNFHLTKIDVSKKNGLIQNNIIKSIMFLPSIDTSLAYDLKKVIINRKNKYDLIITLGHIAYHLSSKFSYKKRLFIMGDPPGERSFVFNKINFKRFTIKGFCLLIYSLICFKLEDYYWKWVINFKNTKIGLFGTSTSIRFKKNLNIKSVLDLRPSMPSYNFGSSYISKNFTKIVMAGSLGGSFALSSISNFIQLIESTNSKKFKFYLIGHDIDIKYMNKNFIDSKKIKILHRVKNLEKTLSRLNIFVIPSDYYIGVRTRICSALSAGNYCILSESILVNMPELLNCSSVKVVKNNIHEIINAIKVYHDFTISKKIRLKKKSKKFFEKNYFYKVSGKRFLDQIH